MNSIPHYLVIQPCCYTSPHSEGQLPIKAFPQQLQDLVSFWGVGQVAGSRSSWEIFSISYTCWHIVRDDDGALRMSRAGHIFINFMFHGSIGLISNHFAEDGATNGTFHPLIFAQHVFEATFMIAMGAWQLIDIFIGLMSNFLFDWDNFEIFQADGTLLIIHFELADFKFAGGEEFYFEAGWEIFMTVLLVDELDEEINGIKVFVFLFDGVFAVELHFNLVIVQMFDSEP